jgi:TPP-dependent pyruvate/acetoin dehydrogenase alpha subunit
MSGSQRNDPSLRMLYDMLRIRMIEEAVAREYPKGEMRCPVHLSIGQEAAAVGVASALQKTDLAVSTHRAHAHYLAKGGSLKRFLAELFGKDTGCSRGRGGSMHLIDLDVGFEGSTAIVGSTLPVGVGLAMAAKVRSENTVTCIFLGDGAIEEGVFYESANFAVVRKLPVLFACENNSYSVYSPIGVRQPHGRKIHELVRAIGLVTSSHDGNDVAAVSRVTTDAVAAIRQGGGPMLLEFSTYRWLEHCGPYPDDNLGYRPVADVAAWKARDPLVVAEAALADHPQFKSTLMSTWRAEIAAEIEAAFEFARTSPWPQHATRGDFVYA